MFAQACLPLACRNCEQSKELLEALECHDRQLPALQACSQSSALNLLQSILPSAIRKIPAGQNVILEGDQSGWILGLSSGFVHCYRINTCGRRHISRFAGPGALIGIEFSGLAHYSVEALTDCEVYAFRQSAAWAAMEQLPSLRLALKDAVTDEFNQNIRSTFRLARLNSDQRVADFILELSEANCGNRVELFMSRLDLADHLGLTLESVSRSIHRLERLGFIQLLNARNVEIVRVEMLKAFVESDPTDLPDLHNKQRRHPGCKQTLPKQRQHDA